MLFFKKVCFCCDRPPIALQTPSERMKNAIFRRSAAKGGAANIFPGFCREALWCNGFRHVRRPPANAAQVRPFPNRYKNSKSSPGDRVRVRPPPPAPSEQPKPLIFQGVSVFFTPFVLPVGYLPISHENALGGHTLEFLRARKAFADAVSGDFGGHLRGHQNPFVYSNKPKIAFADSTFDE